MRDWILASTKEAMKHSNPIIVSPTKLMSNLTLNLPPPETQPGSPNNPVVTEPHNDLSTHFEPAIKTRQLLSGCSTRRRHETIKLIQQQFDSNQSNFKSHFLETSSFKASPRDAEKKRPIVSTTLSETSATQINAFESIKHLGNSFIQI